MKNQFYQMDFTGPMGPTTWKFNVYDNNGTNEANGKKVVFE
jgi:hypothetical protein